MTIYLQCITSSEMSSRVHILLFFYSRYFASKPLPHKGFLAECVICDQLWAFKTFIGGERQIDAFSAACTHQV